MKKSMKKLMKKSFKPQKLLFNHLSKMFTPPLYKIEFPLPTNMTPNKLTSHMHPYHLVSISPWPLLTSFSLMIMLIGSINWFYYFNNMMFLFGMFNLTLCSIQWWRDIIRESTFQGCHLKKIMKILQLGMILFIVSEIFFFTSFFWTFFHMSLSPSIEIGSNWPPLMIKPFNPFNIPLLNTIILLSSGISISWSHYMLLSKKKKECVKSMIITICLGLYFSILQYLEYNESFFSISDSSYGSIFFLLTGFHGIHVIIGTTFLIITLSRIYFNQMSNNHHFGFEASAWYWHFVDVVWLFVYIFLYWWNF